MKYDINDLITKCVEGRAARDVIRSLEEELPDVQSVRSQLLKDCRSAGVVLEGHDVTVEGTQIRVHPRTSLRESSRRALMSICDAYLRTYPEVDVLLAL
jgi:hypothetical protein